jgi:SAM-dependent methyltransferase
MNMELYKLVIHEDFTKDAEFLDSAIKNLDLDNDVKILDIGTGLGAMAILLALNGFNVVTGQPEEDPEWDHISEHHCVHDDDHEHHHPGFFDSDWKENAKAAGVEDKIEFRNMNAESLDFSDESFDGIFMYDTLQHIKQRRAALNECIRVMKRDGVVCVIEWNERSIRDDLEKYGYDIEYIDPGKIVDRNDITIDRIEGEYLNIFVIRKT